MSPRWPTGAQPTRRPRRSRRTAACPPLILEENPDILATLATHRQRPGLLIGFAAETEHVLGHATAKRARKGADWIVANDVSGPKETSVMGGATNEVHLITANGVEGWPEMTKTAVAARLMEKIADELAGR